MLIARRTAGGGFFGNIGCLIFIALFFVASYFMLKGLWWLLFWASPVLLLATLVINYRVVTNAVQRFLEMLGRNPIGGLFTAALLVLGFPFVALFLFLSAIGGRKMEQMQQQFEKQYGFGRGSEPPAETEYVEYEEVDPAQEFDPLKRTSEAEKQPATKPNENPYDGFFNT